MCAKKDISHTFNWILNVEMMPRFTDLKNFSVNYFVFDKFYSRFSLHPVEFSVQKSNRHLAYTIYSIYQGISSISEWS